MKGKITWDRQDKPHFFLDGKEVAEEEFRQVFRPALEANGAGNVGDSLCAWNRPLLSDALAVHPSQCEEAEARNKKHGVNVTYDREDGRAIIPDRNERRKLLKLEQYHDKDGGYGDG